MGEKVQGSKVPCEIGEWWFPGNELLVDVVIIPRVLGPTPYSTGKSGVRHTSLERWVDCRA